MKINNIQSFNFGYNPQYHKQVDEHLSSRKKNKEVALSLLETDKLSLVIEDEIKAMENTPKRHTAKFDNLCDYLIELKDLLAARMWYSFPKLEYPDSLIKTYLEEMKSTKNISAYGWRKQVCKTLYKYANDYYSALGPINSPTSNVAKTESSDKAEEGKQENTTTSKPEQKTSTSIEDLAGQYLEKYSPTISSPNGFESVVGLEDVKLRLQEGIVDYAKNPQQAELDYKEYGISAPRGFLFYGPPGCGKTYITQALAMESGLPMYKMDVSKAGSKYVNQTANNIQNSFVVLKALAAQSSKPILLFMDEVDSLAMSRDRSSGYSGEDVKTVSTLLKQVEAARDNGIIVIAATNKYDTLDEAFKARFDGQIYFPLPDKSQIINLLKANLSSREKGVNLAKDDDKLDELSDMLKGYSNRSITFIVDDAAKRAKRQDRSEITFDIMKQAIDACELEKSEDKKYISKNKTKRTIGFN